MERPLVLLVPGQEYDIVLVTIAIAILLLLAIIVIAVVLWQVFRRFRSSPSPVSPDLEGTGAPLDEADTIPAVVPVTPVDTGGVTQPVPSNDLSKTQPSPFFRKDQPPPPLQPVETDEPRTLPVDGQRPARICWQIAGLTDTGLKRELNEDNLLLAEAEMADASPYGVYIVADGMGGHQSGEVASQLTIGAIYDQFNQQPLNYNAPFNDWIIKAVQAANQAVMAQQADRTQERRMGSTVVLALVTEGQAHIANVGDSRAYHLTNESITQVSVDHSLVERLIQLGQLSREEARTHKQRNVIYNTIGDKPDMEVGLYHVFLQPGDRLLLCSDGLSGMLPDDEILNISQSYTDPAATCKALVEAAKMVGGDDNITAIIIQMETKE